MSWLFTMALVAVDSSWAFMSMGDEVGDLIQ